MKTFKSHAVTRQPYRLFLCFDFPDDLYFTPYTRRSLEALFRLYRSWGVERIYWIYTLKHRERLWECVPSQSLSRNYEITRRRLGEFLPVAVKIAHALGMEFYAVYKPFDIAFDETFPFGTPQARRFGRLDSLSGRVYWSAECLAQRQALRIQRRWDDVPADLDRRQIGAIILKSDQAGRARSRCAPALRAGRNRLTPKTLSLWVSPDNNRYRPYRGPIEYRCSSGPAGQTIRIAGLRIKEPYVVIRTPFHDTRAPRRNLLAKTGATFTNLLDNLVTVLDTQGKPLPLTFGIYSRAERYQLWKNATKAMGRNTLSPNLSTRGYIFNWHNAARRNFLRTTRYGVDNEKGFLAFVKGKERFVTGALSPAYPQARNLWLAHIRECLDAGVDGVDLRPSSHNRNLEWENYGFEPPVRDEFFRRYGRMPGGRAGAGARCREILGGCYTEFVRAASALIRRRGKRVQIHLGREEIMGDTLPIRFEWERWIKEGLADEITLITDYPSHYYRRIAAVVGRRPIPMYFRKYIRAITYRKRWQAMLRRYLRQSRALGQAGFIVYESAFVARGLPDGSFKVLDPDVPRILREFQQKGKKT